MAPDAAGARLDVFLCARLPAGAHSRAEVQAWIEAGRARVTRSGSRMSVTKGLRLREGDQVELDVPPPPPPPAPLAAEDLALAVLHQDEWIAVLDKPAGLAVHPGAGRRAGTLANALLFHCAGRVSTAGGEDRPGIVHRLDKDTSGVIVVARTDAAHRHLARQFHDRTVSKRYLAIVSGGPPDDEGTVDQPIGRHPVKRKQMVVRPAGSEGAREAVTRYVVLERFRDFALVECRPLTGRTHQVRVHMRALGCPLLADAVYGRGAALAASGVEVRRATRPRSRAARTPSGMQDLAARGPGQGEVVLARHALHAESLTFAHPDPAHPSRGAPLTFTAPLAADMAAALDLLRRLDLR